MQSNTQNRVKIPRPQHTIRDPDYLAKVEAVLIEEIARIRALPIGSDDVNFRAIIKRMANQHWTASLGLTHGEFKEQIRIGKFPELLESCLMNDKWMRSQLINKIRDRLYKEIYEALPLGLRN